MNSAAHLQFNNVAEPGYFAEERVVLRPTVKMNLMDYVMLPMRSASGASDAEDLNTLAYWFPDKEVEPGDFVLLYTKTGNDHTFTDANGQAVHVFYWNKEAAVWKDPASVVAILKISEWAFHGIREPALQMAG